VDCATRRLPGLLYSSCLATPDLLFWDEADRDFIVVQCAMVAKHISTKEGLTTQAARDKWRNGIEGKGLLEYQGGANGYAVVASALENKIVFIELRPPFQQRPRCNFTTAVRTSPRPATSAC
jgi:hypothetical protein